MGSIEYRLLEDKFKPETISGVDSTNVRAPAYSFRERDLKGTPKLRMPPPPDPGPGTYTASSLPNRLAPRVLNTPHFHSKASASLSVRLSGSPGSPTRSRRFPEVSTTTSCPSFSLRDSSPGHSTRTSFRALPMMAPTHMVQPSPVHSPNTCRSITVNDARSQSPLRAGPQKAQMRRGSSGAHATSGPGGSWGLRTRGSCFTRGLSPQARDTTLHPCYGGRSAEDRRLDEHTLGPGQYGEIMDQNRKLFGPGWVKQRGQVTEHPDKIKACDPPCYKFNPVHPERSKRPEKTRHQIPGPGDYSPSLRIDKHSHHFPSYTMSKKLPSMFNPSIHVDPLNIHPHAGHLTGSTVPWSQSGMLAAMARAW